MRGCMDVAECWSHLSGLLYCAGCCYHSERKCIRTGATFMGSTTQETFAFKDSDGTNVWGTPEIGGILSYYGSTVTAPAVLNGIVYIGSSLPAFPAIGSLRAYDTDTGKACWNYTYLSVLGEINSAPALVTEAGKPFAYIGTSAGLQKIDAACSGGGSTVWAKYAGGPVGFSSPVVANVDASEVIFVGTANGGAGGLEAYDPTGKDLSLNGAFGNGTAIQAAPTVYGTSVYANDQDGNIYVYR